MPLKKFSQYLVISATGAATLTGGLTLVGRYYGIDDLKTGLNAVQKDVNEVKVNIAEVTATVNEIKRLVKYEKFNASIGTNEFNWHGLSDNWMRD